MNGYPDSGSGPAPDGGNQQHPYANGAQQGGYDFNGGANPNSPYAAQGPSSEGRQYGAPAPYGYALGAGQGPQTAQGGPAYTNQPFPPYGMTAQGGPTNPQSGYPQSGYQPSAAAGGYHQANMSQGVGGGLLQNQYIRQSYGATPYGYAQPQRKSGSGKMIAIVAGAVAAVVVIVLVIVLIIGNGGGNGTEPGTSQNGGTNGYMELPKPGDSGTTDSGGSYLNDPELEKRRQELQDRADKLKKESEDLQKQFQNSGSGSYSDNSTDGSEYLQAPEPSWGNSDGSN
ncbi:hypothetical protein [Bifidobacterium jacchi]|uniref:Uncharacterized protein n=1 Tax=Bifidobacterium jacchi TaxID=2490545 RepID=A0A5N5RHV4_9BIFI|nr:hypothetical protein [Bifidobacterium jacchi]KAB5606834.1 hypothetical protein EHS19_06305 [Bifidobacterium jacchi]